MSNDVSLETRASAAYVQGRLAELLDIHINCSACGGCDMLQDLREIVKEWKQAEAELKAQKESK